MMDFKVDDFPAPFLPSKATISPWGSGTYSGPDGSRQPTSMELSIAENHGRHFAKLTAKISA